jgi:hypothetical protein
LKQATVRTAGQASLILFVIGLLIMSPPLRFSLFALAALCAFLPAVRGPVKWRITGIIIVIVAVIFAFNEWPAASGHMKHYRERNRSHQVSQLQVAPSTHNHFFFLNR